MIDSATERHLDVSRETLGRLEAIVALLQRWQSRINLIAPSTLPEVWRRHVEDSLQLPDLRPEARHWIDLGSGGGFPGLVIAAAMAERGGQVTMIESHARKCAFLREAVRVAGLPATVLHGRIEEVLPGLQADVLCARALAPLPHLLALAKPLLKTGTPALFPKGRGWEAELTEAEKSWTLAMKLHESRVEPGAFILEILSAVEREP